MQTSFETMELSAADVAKLLNGSPNFMAIIATLTLVDSAETTYRVTPTIMSHPGSGKTSMLQSLAHIMESTDGLPLRVYEVNAPDISKPVNDIGDYHNYRYVYALDLEEEVRAMYDLESGEAHPLVVFDEAGGIPPQFVARVLRRIIGDPRKRRIRMALTTNPPDMYHNPDPFEHANMRQRAGYPISMEIVEREPVIQLLRRMNRIDGYRKFIRFEPSIEWDEDLYEHVNAAYKSAVQSSDDTRGIPTAYRSERQCEYFAAHLMAASSLLKANGLPSDPLSYPTLLAAIAEMRFSPSGARAIENALGEMHFDLDEFMKLEGESLVEYLKGAKSRLVAFSARRVIRNRIKDLYTDYVAGQTSQEKLVQQVKAYLKRADECQKLGGPLASVVSRAIYEFSVADQRVITTLQLAGVPVQTILQKVHGRNKNY